MEIGNGLYWGGDIEIIKELLLINKITPSDIRFSVGYSGWSPDQLQEELKRDSWLVSKNLHENILRINPNILWKELVEPLGDEYRLWSKFPSNPNLN